MSRLLLLFVAGAAVAFPLGTGGMPPEPSQPRLPVGRWSIEFANGVREVCEVRKDGTASVVEPLRSADGNVEIKDGSVVIGYQDDRLERWTPVGRKMIVEHWFPAAAFPSGKPVLGVGEITGPKGLLLSIRLGRGRYRAGEPVPLEVVIKNAGDAEVYLGMSALDVSSFEFLVRYVGGGITQAGTMPLTKYGAKLHEDTPSKNIPIQLKRGEERRYRFTLNRIVDLTLSGTYSITLRRSVQEQPRHDDSLKEPTVLLSNELSVEITEPFTPSR